MWKATSMIALGFAAATSGAALANDLLPTDTQHLSPYQFVRHSAPGLAAASTVIAAPGAAPSRQQAYEATDARAAQWMRRPIILDGANR